MTDIVERLRNVFPIGWEGEMRHEAADEIERLREVLALGIHMREAQTTYFKTRSRDALIASKALEQEFLDRARALLKESER